MTFALLLLGKFKNLRFCHPVAGVIFQNFLITFCVLQSEDIIIVVIRFTNLLPVLLDFADQMVIRRLAHCVQLDFFCFV